MLPEHTIDNLKVSKGDPCRLTGYKLSFVKRELVAGHLPDNGLWRMPTEAEN